MGKAANGDRLEVGQRTPRKATPGVGRGPSGPAGRSRRLPAPPTAASARAPPGRSSPTDRSSLVPTTTTRSPRCGGLGQRTSSRPAPSPGCGWPVWRCALRRSSSSKPRHPRQRPAPPGGRLGALLAEEH